MHASWELRSGLVAAACAALLVGCGGGGREPSVEPAEPDWAALQCTAAQPGQGWCWQRPQPFATAIHAMAFADALHGLAGGDAGRMLRTVDGGRSWSVVQLPVDRRIEILEFKSGRWAYAATRGFGSLYRSADLGATWTRLDVSPLIMGLISDGRDRLALLTMMPSSPVLESGLRFSPDAGASWGPALLGYTSATFIGESIWVNGRRSVDGGATFERPAAWHEDFRPKVFGDMASQLAIGNQFRVVDQGWVQEPLAGRSSDGGLTWTLFTPSLPGGFGTSTLNALGASAAHAWMSAVPSVAPFTLRLLHSGDRGATWTDVSPPTMVAGESLVDGPHAVAASDTPGAAWVTHDAGRTWSALGWPESVGATAVVASDGYGWWTSAAAGAVARSADQGRSWTLLPYARPDTQPFTGLWFHDPLRGLALTADGRLFGTRDGGLAWTARASSLGAGPTEATALQFVGDTGWLIDGQGRVQRSDDRGASWNVVALGTAVGQLSMRASGRGVATARPCQVGLPCGVVAIHTTSDGGRSWTMRRIEPPTLEGMVTRVMVTDQGSLLAADYDDVKVSADGGASWAAASGPCATRGDVPVQWAQDAAGTLWLLRETSLARSTDGGRSWQCVTVPLADPELSYLESLRMRAIALGADGAAWITTRAGAVLATRDGGRTWKRQARTTGQDLRSAFALDGQRVWLAGDGGIVLATRSGGE